MMQLPISLTQLFFLALLLWWGCVTVLYALDFAAVLRVFAQIPELHDFLELFPGTHLQRHQLEDSSCKAVEPLLDRDVVRATHYADMQRRSTDYGKFLDATELTSVPFSSCFNLLRCCFRCDLDFRQPLTDLMNLVSDCRAAKKSLSTLGFHLTLLRTCL